MSWRICSSVSGPPKSRLQAGMLLPETPPAMSRRICSSDVEVRNCLEFRVGPLLVACGAGAQGRFLDPVEHEPKDQDHHEHKTPRVVTIQAALQPLGFEGGRLGGLAGHGHLLVMQAGPSGGVRKSRFPRAGPVTSVPVSTTNIPLSSRSWKRSIPRGAGPWTYSPAMSYTEPWQGHSNRPEVLQKGTRQPRCGHFWDRAKKCPPALASQSRPSLK